MVTKLGERGVSLSINTVIILTLAILVLVVVSAFFIRNLGKADNTTTDYIDRVEAQATCGKQHEIGSEPFDACVLEELDKIKDSRG
jgi:hypothetical protein